MLANPLELIPGFVAGVGAFLYAWKRQGTVRMDTVAAAVLAVTVLGSLLFESPVAVSRY